MTTTYQDAATVAKVGANSPWGRIDHAEEITPGVVIVTTPSHGGAYVSQSLLHHIPANLRAYGARWSHGMGNQWYEEDLAIIAPFAHIPGIPAETRERALEMLPTLLGYAS